MPCGFVNASAFSSIPKVIFSSLKTSTIQRIPVRLASGSWSNLGPDGPTDTLIDGVKYKADSQTNVTPRILSYLGKKIHLQDRRPLNLIQRRIVDYMYQRYKGPRGPLFSLHDRLSPVVTVEANFDSLLVPKDHVSRKNSDSYYLNSEYMLRAHTSAHQTELIRMGLDNFMVAGDVYRRDTVDKTHYPVFHQIEGVRLVNEHDLPSMVGSTRENTIKAFEDGIRTTEKQAFHSMDACKIIEQDLKGCLLGLAKELFGQGA